MFGFKAADCSGVMCSGVGIPDGHGPHRAHGGCESSAAQFEVLPPSDPGRCFPAWLCQCPLTSANAQVHRRWRRDGVPCCAQRARIGDAGVGGLGGSAEEWVSPHVSCCEASLLQTFPSACSVGVQEQPGHCATCRQSRAEPWGFWWKNVDCGSTGFSLPLRHRLTVPPVVVEPNECCVVLQSTNCISNPGFSWSAPALALHEQSFLVLVPLCLDVPGRVCVDSFVNGIYILGVFAGCHRVVVKNENAALTKMQPSALIYVLPLKTESLKVRGRTWFGWSTPAPQPSHSSLLPARGGDRDHCCLRSPWSSWQLPGHCMSQPGSGTVPRVPAACEHTTTGLRGLLCVLVPAGRQDAGSVGTSPCPALPCTWLPVGFVPAPALAPEPLCFTGRCRAA